MRMNVSKSLAVATGLFFLASGAQAVEVFANGGFEVNDGTTATGWLSAAGGYTISGDANSGSSSIALGCAQFCASVALQNSVADGGNPPISLDAIGTTPTLSLWSKGFAGTTGNVLFSLRYLDGIGNILYNSGNQFFQGSINPNTWTNITFNGGPIPVGTVAAFLEISRGIGPVNGVDLFGGTVLIDDVSMNVVPVPAAVWLFGSSLGLLGWMRRRAG